MGEAAGEGMLQEESMGGRQDKVLGTTVATSGRHMILIGVSARVLRYLICLFLS